MPNQVSNPNSHITKDDLNRIEASIKQVIQVAKFQKDQEANLTDMLKTLSVSVHQLKTQVEFDHEKRLSAIEDFLQNL